jgi:hypothetical protein
MSALSMNSGSPRLAGCLWNTEFQLSEIQVLFQDLRLQGKVVGSTTARPHRKSSSVFADGKLGVSTSRCCEVLREIFLGVSCEGDDPIQGYLFG